MRSPGSPPLLSPPPRSPSRRFCSVVIILIFVGIGLLLFLGVSLPRLVPGARKGGGFVPPQLVAAQRPRTTTSEFSQFPSLSAHRSTLFSDAAVKSVCIPRVGDGSSVLNALQSSADSTVYVMDPIPSNGVDMATALRMYPNRLVVTGDDHLRLPFTHPGVKCDVVLLDYGSNPFDVTLLEDALALGACDSKVLVRFDASQSPLLHKGALIQYRHPAWLQATIHGLVTEIYCDIAESMFSELDVSIDCVGTLHVVSLPCVTMSDDPSRADPTLFQLIKSNDIQRVWAKESDFTYRWSIGIYAGEHPVNSTLPLQHNPVLIPEQLWDQPSDFVADPLLIWVPDPDLPSSVSVRPDALVPVDSEGNVTRGVWYMFYETLSTLSWNGDIGWASSVDGIRWRHGGIALDEPFHLSFPTIFRWGGAYYMMPETHANDTITLYHSPRFPEQWSMAKHYFVNTGSRFGTAFVDHIILHVPVNDSIDGSDTVFMFTFATTANAIFLFYMESSEFPLGDWTLHPKSPITSFKATGRNLTDDSTPPWTPRTCGRIVIAGGRRYRFAQHHGERVFGSEITLLSRSEYAESPCENGPVLAPSQDTQHGVGWRYGGMHTFDAHPLDNNGTKWIIAVDGRKDYRDTPY